MCLGGRIWEMGVGLECAVRFLARGARDRESSREDCCFARVLGKTLYHTGLGTGQAPSSAVLLMCCCVGIRSSTSSGPVDSGEG